MAHRNLITNPKFDTIQEGFELISNGLLILEQHRGFLEELGGKNAVDIAARMNSLSNAMVSVLDPMKAKIKAEAVADQGTDDEWETKRQGNKYMAVVTRCFRSVTDMDLVETLLAKMKKPVPKKKQPIVQVAFEVKQ